MKKRALMALPKLTATDEMKQIATSDLPRKEKTDYGYVREVCEYYTYLRCIKQDGIKADIKSISENTDRDNLQKCRIQGKYAGRVTDVHKGVVYVRLSNGVNAVAHSCYDYRMPGKKDDVSFAVTRLDMERGVAVGIITRIIRQNL